MSAAARRRTHFVLAACCGFLALTAMAGGASLMSGTIAPGDDLLRGSPFSTYAIPGLVLLVVVGGSALIATVLLVVGHGHALPAAAVAGAMIVGFEVVEVWVIGSPPGLGRNLQVFYLVFGATIAAVSIRDRLATANTSDTPKSHASRRAE